MGSSGWLMNLVVIRKILRVPALCAGVLISVAAAQFLSSPSNDAPFSPLEQWRSAIVTGDLVALKMLYSVNPAATIGAGKAEKTVGADAEVDFWRKLKVEGLKLKIEQSDSPQPGMHQVIFIAEVKSAAKAPARTVYVSEGQLWVQQEGQWRIAAAKRGDVTRLEQPIKADQNLYPAGVDAKAEIKEALEHAARDHKRVLLVFGANWCY
ncbi:MAG TPA: hypothetical protein VH744_14030, partial [Terriglobales bacterium]